MTLRLNSSGGGYVEADAPNIAGNYALTLPTSAGSAGQYLRNSSTAGTLEFANGGKILQVVNVVHSTLTSTTSTSFVDSGLTASITPSSSSNKVLVIVSQTLTSPSAGTSTFGQYRLMRDTTSIYADQRIDMYEQYSHNTYTISYLDSPASTSSVTYKTQIATDNASYILEAQHGSLRPSTITLIEVQV